MIELRHLNEYMVADIAIEDTHCKNREQCPEDVPKQDIGVFVNGSSGESAVELVEEQNTDTDNFLVEEVDTT